jgi:V-type H+-transporting ATPase subunit G
VREARDEAKKEIEEYRANKESEYKGFEAQHTQGNKAAEEEANKEADEKINEIQAAGTKHRDEIIKNLLSAVSDAHPTPVS